MDEKPEIYNIPSNYKTPGKWRGIAIPNLVEGIIVAFIIDYCFVRAPFTFQFKLIVVILASVGIVIFFIKGINGERISLFLFSFIKFIVLLIGRKGKYHMRKVEVKDVETPKSRDTGKRAKDISEVISSLKIRTKDNI